MFVYGHFYCKSGRLIKLDKFTLHVYNLMYTKFTWQKTRDDWVQEEDYDFAKNPEVYAYYQHAALSDYDLLFFALPDYYVGHAAYY